MFYKRLKELGFNNYKEYLNSKYWREAKKRYNKAKFPNRCLSGCSGRYELHHRSYVRLGRELPTDLVPLCRKCHEKVHDYHNYNNTQLQHTGIALKKINKWNEKTLRKTFKKWMKNGKVISCRKKDKHPLPYTEYDWGKSWDYITAINKQKQETERVKRLRELKQRLEETTKTS